MQKFLLILLIILIICIAFLSIIMLRSRRKIGGSTDEELPDPLVLEIYESLKPYWRDIDNSNHAVAYLKDYTRLVKVPKYKIMGIPGKHLSLYHVIEHVVDEHRIRSVREFWKKTEINYAAFMPKSKAQLLKEVYLTPKTKDVNGMARAIDDHLIENDVRLGDSELRNVADALLRYNRIYKLKRGLVKYGIARLRKMLKRDPKLVIEYDIMPIAVRLEPCTLKKIERPSEVNLYRIVSRMDRKTLLEELKQEQERLEKEKSHKERERLEKKIKALREDVEKLREPKKAPSISKGTQTTLKEEPAHKEEAAPESPPESIQESIQESEILEEEDEEGPSIMEELEEAAPESIATSGIPRGEENIAQNID
jgi:hypothetical protein